MSTKNQDKQETISDIVAEMRNWWPHDPLKYPYPEEKDNKDLCSFADRIESAWKREKAEIEADALNVGAIVATTEKSSAVGNVSAMRDALLKLDKWLYIGADGRIHGLHDKTGEIERTIKAAIDAPARNCDVGTPEEQVNRFILYCDKHSGCHECQCSGMTPLNRCEFVWAQMPYEEKGGK